MGSAREEAFRIAMQNRTAAITLARTMLATVVAQPQFKPGLGAALRTEPPKDAIEAIASLFGQRGDPQDAAALRRLANVVAFHALTWREIDGN